MTLAERIGRHLLELQRRKRDEGRDFYISSSWCSDEPIVVIVTRPAGVRAPVGRPVVRAEMLAALEAAVGRP